MATKYFKVLSKFKKGMEHSVMREVGITFSKKRRSRLSEQITNRWFGSEACVLKAEDYTNPGMTINSVNAATHATRKE